MREEIRNCQNCKKEFIIESEDFEFYKKISDSKSEIKVPAPTWCPDCRLQRRYIWRNQGNLYKRKCDFSGREIFSQFSPKVMIKVYDIDVWYSDKWNALRYGKKYDFGKSFFNQEEKLLKEVPLSSRVAINLVNSDYCMNAGELKDCYLVFNAGTSENCSYGSGIDNSRDSVDNCYLTESELCYQSFMLTDCYKAFFASHCNNCQDILFCNNCNNCNNCFGCMNLRSKSYCIFNKQYLKKEYERRIKEFNLGSSKFQLKILKQTKELFLKFPTRFMYGVKNVNAEGNYLDNCKNVKNSFMIKNAEHLKFCFDVRFSPSAKDCYDYTGIGRNTELAYEDLIVGRNASKIKFSINCFENIRNLEYCIQCISCSDCFGCVSLRNKQYCILNKQYSKEEYFSMVEKIKKQMNEMPYIDKLGRVYKYGEFFPPEFSPFAYNETVAQEYFPLNKREVVSKGYKWKESEDKNYQVTIEAKDLPDHIDDVDDSILKEVIGCNTNKSDREQVSCTTAFKVIPKELEFYKKMNIPLPRYCPNCRHHQRLENRNSPKLYKRVCMKEGCNTEFKTTYAPDCSEIVYCEKCYQNEVA